MVCGSEGWTFENDESKERYIAEFSLEGDQRPKSKRTGKQYFLLLPASYLRPSKCERKGGTISCLYKLVGVQAFKDYLKKFEVYPKPIRGTARGTIERQRALIATVPITIAYEVGHTTTALIHILASLLVSGPFLGYSGNDKIKAFLSWPLLGLNFVAICGIHLFPILLQRLNRAQLYDAIQENESTGIGRFMDRATVRRENQGKKKKVM